MSSWQRSLVASAALAAAFLAGQLTSIKHPAADDQGKPLVTRTALASGSGPSSASACPPSPSSEFGAALDAMLASRLAPLVEELHTLRSHVLLEDHVNQQAAVVDDRFDRSQSQRFEDASRFVDDRLALGAWTETDREEFRGLIVGLSAPEADQVLGTLVGALNEGRIQIQTAGPPL